MREMRNSQRILVSKHEEKCSVGRPKLRREDNIKTDLEWD